MDEEKPPPAGDMKDHSDSRKVCTVYRLAEENRDKPWSKVCLWCGLHRMKFVICCSSVFALVAVVTVATAFFLPYPLHASCRINWTFGKPCQEVKKTLVEQMNVWESRENCGTGQKCLYEYTGERGPSIIATHTTPKQGYVDDLVFTFFPQKKTNSCRVFGFSSSRVWYAILDFSTNYCNLHNLVDGAGLNKNDKNYTESTRDRVCTQYSSANCEVY